MTLHVFNPEHDIALASGLANFTAPHAARQLRHDLGFLPALWAAAGDAVLTDDPDYAYKQYGRTAVRTRRMLGVTLPTLAAESFLPSTKPLPAQVTAVNPWGWNEALVALLRRRGLSADSLPDAVSLQAIRQWSHRQTAARLLPQLRQQGTVGEMFATTTEAEVMALLERYGQLVLKSPWSSSGRGLRFLSLARTPFSQHARWFDNQVAAQGCVMVEPYYQKVKDFGMEFETGEGGVVNFLGLSLFHTENGAYIGNILATEKVKKEMITRYIPAELLETIKERICISFDALTGGGYRGPFGVDMMVVANADGGFLLHPCVEINLRRTMGHVALALTPADDDVRCVMRTVCNENKYQLTINRL